MAAKKKKRAGKRKSARKNPAQKRKGGKRKAARSNQIPLAILEKRAKKLTALVRKRGGTA